MKANSKRKVFGDAVDLLMGDMAVSYTHLDVYKRQGYRI